jgi:hypothetical protein
MIMTGIATTLPPAPAPSALAIDSEGTCGPLEGLGSGAREVGVMILGLIESI